MIPLVLVCLSALSTLTTPAAEAEVDRSLEHVVLSAVDRASGSTVFSEDSRVEVEGVTPVAPLAPIVEASSGPPPGNVLRSSSAPASEGEADRGKAIEVLTIELEKVGLGTGRLGRPGLLRNRANEEASAHCPDNKCVAEDPVGAEMYTDLASVAFVASRTLMSTGLVVWLVSARKGTERQTSIGPRLGGISLQGTF